ncbi:serine/threonine-protein kinase [Pseudofrankia sp. DC12]|uniref:serine/threonine-protein kinase n=1 Tax=Pseudofrankia sp. DC12 TaxID=683315 RepID=UPI0005F7CFCA|nr:serine/threonine-protein kinase [Pseudofrankia sp. DC12]
MTETGVPLQERRPGDPEMLGRHRVLGRLGAGGMGVVYLAEGPFGRVAVKLIREDLADDPDFRRRFQREVQACFRVGGTRTARLVDFELAAVRPWLATEFVDALNLAEHVREHGPLNADEQLLLGAGLAEALLSIHATGLIHRDFKPSNVLWTAQGPKVIDFGIAAAADAAGLTSTGHFVGTPGWHSPEQVSGLEVTGAADVFAWGGLLCYAATGKAPFGTGTPELVLHRVAAAEPAVDRELIAPALRDVVASAMARDPAARPTAADLYATLVGPVPSDVSLPVTRVLQTKPGDTPPATPVAMAPTPPWSATVAAGQAAPPSAARPRRSRRLIATFVVGGVLLLAAAGTLVGLLATRDSGQTPASAGSSSEFTADAPWRITIDDQITGNDDQGCTVTVLDGGGVERGKVDGIYGRKTYQVSVTGVFHWTVNNDECAVTPEQGSGDVPLPFAQQAYSGDTQSFQAPGPISVDPIDFGDADTCDLMLRAVDGRTLDFTTAHKGAGPVTLNPGAPTEVYLAEPGCGIKIAAAG